MPIIENVKETGGIIGRLDCGVDLLQGLTAICKEKNITLGQVTAIGAVQRACVGYYDQDTRTYEFTALDEHLEILNLTGNISLKDGEPIIHAHVTLSDSRCKAFGGHLAEGTIVFACEYNIEAMKGPSLERGFDEETGLPLWPMDAGK